MTPNPSRDIRRGLPLALAGAVLSSFLLSGCGALVVGGIIVGSAMVATDRRTTGAQVDDETIEVKSSSRMSETFADRARIDTTSYNRMVLLTGEVPTAEDKTRAEQVAAGVPNVRSVVNEITVGPLNTFSERSKDTYVTTKVKTSLVDAKDLFANSIKVTTHRGVVYLMGRVTEREATRASEVARGVSGVAKVVRVFEVLSESELAQTQPKTLAQPDTAASAAVVRP
jgi:osmotically-inducible protein OsmY